jgi:hypothetical protein
MHPWPSRSLPGSSAECWRMAPNDDSDLEMTSYWAYYQLLWTTPTLPVAAQVTAQPYKAYKTYKCARRLLFGQSELQRLLYHAQLDETTRLWLSEYAIRCCKVLAVCSVSRLGLRFRCRTGRAFEAAARSMLNGGGGRRAAVPACTRHLQQEGHAQCFGAFHLHVSAVVKVQAATSRRHPRAIETAQCLQARDLRSSKGSRLGNETSAASRTAVASLQEGRLCAADESMAGCRFSVSLRDCGLTRGCSWAFKE